MVALRHALPQAECGGGSPHFFVPETLARQHVNDDLERIVIEELDAVGFDLVELRRGGTRARPVFELRIDRRDGGSVTIDDCARVSRVVEARLDTTEVSVGLVPERYVLQVSSPGERPLRTPADWRRFVGRWASVVIPEEGGRLEGTIVSVGGEAGAETVVIGLGRGEQKRLPLAAVKEARLAFHW
jgi:ribosome maturation factor RimP